jgi:hypothetical protein
MDMQAATALTGPLSLHQLLLYGGLGALLVEALKFVRKMQGGQWPSTLDFVVSAILIAIGAIVTGLYQNQVQSALAAAQIGASAPAIVGAWASGGPHLPAGGGGRGLSRALSWRA